MNKSNTKKTMLNKKKGFMLFLLFIVFICIELGFKQYDKEIKEHKLQELSETKSHNERELFSHDEQENEYHPCPDLYAKAAALLDSNNGRVLIGKNENEELPMASTTKIMTCILALEFGEKYALDEQWATVSKQATRQPKVKAYLKEDEEYRVSDLLYSMMLESHNDTAYVVAEHIGRKLLEKEKNIEIDSQNSVLRFAQWMNEKAKELGCEHTYFITPNGLDAENERGIHHTTAKELGIIASYAIKNEQFREIINTKNYYFSDKEEKHHVNVSNKNAFLEMNEDACGIKTGFTSKAGYCFVGAIKNTDQYFISVVLGCGWPPEKGKKWRDTQNLMKYGKENYREETLNFEQSELYVQLENGKKSICRANVKSEKPQKMLIATWESMNVKRYYDAKIVAPVHEGAVIGYEIYYIDSIPCKKLPICAAESIDSINISYCIDKVLDFWLL